MPNISYVDPATVTDPELQEIMERLGSTGRRGPRARRSAGTTLR